jgi:death-on-curing protein
VTVYLSLEQLLWLHQRQARVFGGAHGVRDRGAAEAALARPQMTFGGEDLYSDVESKAAALMHSVVADHPFLDGNKRAGAAVAEFFLNLNGVDLIAEDDELIDVTLSVAKGELTAEALSIWCRQRTRRREG